MRFLDSFWVGSLLPRRPLFPILGGALALAVALLTSARPAAAATVPPGANPCLTNDVPPGFGTFVMLKGTAYRQPSGSAPAEAPAPSSFALFNLISPDAYSVSNAIVTGPAAFRAPLVDLSDGQAQWTNAYPSAANLNAALLPGAWNTAFDLVLTNGDSFVGFFPFLVASNFPPVAEISNLQAAQAIAPASAFSLSWVPWTGSSTNERIAITIADGAGRTVVSAATDCAGEFSLAPGATSFDIPAGRLSPGSSYTGYLTFGSLLFNHEDPSALLLQRGYHAHTTSFPLRTTGSGGGEPATLGNLRVTVSNLVFTVTGTPGGTYLVQSTPDLAIWTDETSVLLPASGTAEVTLNLPADGMPRFYRAISTGGGGGTADPAMLEVAVAGPRLLRLTVHGTPGATYTIESTTNYLAWSLVQQVTVPAPATNVIVDVTVPADTDFYVLRAVAASGPPPPDGMSPTLAITRDGTSLRIAATGGDANRTYIIQTTVSWNAWTNSSLSITTDAAGSGSTPVPLDTAEPAAFFRALAQ